MSRYTDSVWTIVRFDGYVGEIYCVALNESQAIHYSNLRATGVGSVSAPVDLKPGDRVKQIANGQFEIV